MQVIVSVIPIAAFSACRQALRVPVCANGNVRTLRDADNCMAATGADAVLIAGSPASTECFL